MESTKNWNMFKVKLLVLAIGLALTAYPASSAFACWDSCNDSCWDYCMENGWMTGGGSIFPTDGRVVTYGGQVSDDGRVTHGFVLHCTPRNSDNLQVVDHGSKRIFHLETLDRAFCYNDPLITPDPPDANFDTFFGSGHGRCKEPDGHWLPCKARWKFTDGGERGGCVRDTAAITVRLENSNSVDPFIFIDGNVDCGNHQAHSK